MTQARRSTASSTRSSPSRRCERFLDTPVKRYSSGMYVRLAFAVAAHLEPEILIVDEVLAVGDAAFQRKCLGQDGRGRPRGRTVLFVSHNMARDHAALHAGDVARPGPLASPRRRGRGGGREDLAAGADGRGEHVHGGAAGRAGQRVRTPPGGPRPQQCRSVASSLDVRLPFTMELILYPAAGRQPAARAPGRGARRDGRVLDARSGRRKGRASAAAGGVCQPLHDSRRLSGLPDITRPRLGQTFQ